ncbi:MAG: SAM-dependent methyltransferase [Pseudoduganella sp.]|jgi:23S rRNA (cytosine1962-C5)-methyltransferase|nr:SAM-dependent methyltransferase [Pseudoduganella sp.]
MLTIIIKQGKEASILAGDPYIYLSAVERVDGRPAEKNKPGATATVLSSSRKFLARAAYNAKSQIAARVWTLREDEPIDHALVKRRVRAAVARRNHLLQAARPDALVPIVLGEEDGLSGLLVHSYGGKDGYLVCQFQSAAVEAWKVAIVQALIAETGCPNVYERADKLIREGEGLHVKSRALAGDEPPSRLTVSERGRSFPYDIRTGFEYPK